MIQKTFVLRGGWLHFPIARSAERRYVRFESNGRQFAELFLGLSETPDFYCGMELERRVGEEIVVTADGEAPAGWLDGVR